MNSNASSPELAFVYVPVGIVTIKQFIDQLLVGVRIFSHYNFGHRWVLHRAGSSNSPSRAHTLH